MELSNRLYKMLAVLGLTTLAATLPAAQGLHPLHQADNDSGIYHIGIHSDHLDPNQMLNHHLHHTIGEFGGKEAVVHDIRKSTDLNSKKPRAHSARVTMSHEGARRLASSGNFEYVEEDEVIMLPEDGMEPPMDDLIDFRYPDHPDPPLRDLWDMHTVHETDSWALDRIDQTSLFLDSKFKVDYDGDNTLIYVLDTGVRGDHTDFGSRVLPGKNLVTWSSDGYEEAGGDGEHGNVDCHGHGTHVASTAAGTTWGVAKGATIVPVRVFDCNGQSARSVLIGAVQWAVNDYAQNHPGKQAVISMSLLSGYSTAFNDAVDSAVNAGLAVVVAAGNHNRNACMFSPASEPSAITVGATDSRDFRSSFSNWGYCVDIFAPGQSVRAADAKYPTGHKSLSGTSMATPLVSGTVALVWEKNPELNAREVMDYVRNLATTEHVYDLCEGSTNSFLQLPSEESPEDPSKLIEPPQLEDAPWSYLAKGPALDGYYTGWKEEFVISKEKYLADGYCMTFHAENINGDASKAGVLIALSSGLPHGSTLNKKTKEGSCYYPYANWYFLDAVHGHNAVLTKVDDNLSLSDKIFSLPNGGANFWVRVKKEGNGRKIEFGAGRVEGNKVLLEYTDSSRQPDVIRRMAFSSTRTNTIQYSDIQRCGEAYDGPLTNPDEEEEKDTAATFSPSASPTAPTMSPTASPTSDDTVYIAPRRVSKFTEFRKNWDSRIPGVMCFEFDSKAKQDIYLLLAETNEPTSIKGRSSQYVLKIGSGSGRRAEFLRNNRRKKRTNIDRSEMRNGKASHFKFELDSDGVIRVYMNDELILEQFDFIKLKPRYFSVAAGRRYDVKVTNVQSCTSQLNAKPANPVCEDIVYRTLCKRKTKQYGCKWGRKYIDGKRQWTCYNSRN